MTQEPVLLRVDRLELAFKPKPWAFADQRRAEIDAYFAKRQRDNPALWNGRVLLLYHQVVQDGVFRGDYLETDYASFSTWKAWGRPPAGIHDCFGAAAIAAADGAFLLGVMGPHTFNAGEIYFPSGTPDRDDIKGSQVDLEFSVRRELKEETGLDAAELGLAPGWICVVHGGLIVQIKLMRSSQSADELRARIVAHLASEKQPELSDIRIVRGPQDFDPAMPRFVTAFLAQHFSVR
jgi:8-oxo-dGTP pyrophosphatase MutT (NUDIX family)